MILLNFTHPLLPAHISQIELLAQRPIQRLVEVMPTFAEGEALNEQVRHLADSASLTSREWQSPPLVVNLPGLSAAACCLLAEIHGRHGQFPVICRVVPVRSGPTTEYAVSELIDLQAVRADARGQR